MSFNSIRRRVRRVPGVDDEDVGRLGEAFHAVGEGFVMDVVDLDPVERLLSELAKAACDAFGQGINCEALSGQNAANLRVGVIGFRFRFWTEFVDHFG